MFSVTGGASFIGSRLADQLLEKGVKSLRVVDDLSSGTAENIQHHVNAGRVELVTADLGRARPTPC